LALLATSLAAAFFQKKEKALECLLRQQARFSQGFFSRRKKRLT
jgi:hypothetical protein